MLGNPREDYSNTDIFRLEWGWQGVGYKAYPVMQVTMFDEDVDVGYKNMTGTGFPMDHVLITPGAWVKCITSL